MEKIVFYLMNEKGYYVLEQFLGRFGAESLAFIVLAEDKNIKDDYYLDIVAMCKKNNIACFDRGSVVPNFNGYKFAIGWRWIIPNCNNLIVLHDAILPKYRGFSPIVNMLINGEREIGVTALWASNEYDSGDIIKQAYISVKYPIKINGAIKKISPLYSALVNDIADKIFDNQAIIGTPQNNDIASYSLWRDEQDYFIDWREDSQRIRRKVDALGEPYNGAKTYLNGEIIIIDEVEEYNDMLIENRDFGKVILFEDKYPVVVCGKGLLKILKARFTTGNSIIPLKKFRSRFGRNNI